MTEDVKIRVTADADQMVAEMANATRALRQMSSTADRTAKSTNQAVKSIEFQTLGRNALEAGHKIVEMARATYQMATAWRDAHRDLGTGSEGVRALSAQVTQAEESIRQMTDIAGTLSAALVGALEPTLKGARVAMGAFATFTLRAGVELAYLRDTIADFLISMYDQELGVKSAALTLADYEQGLRNIDDLTAQFTRSTESQTQAATRAATVEDRRAKIAQEIGAAQRQLLNIADQAASDQLSDQERIVAAYRDQLDVIGDVESAALALAQTESAIASTRQAATLARTEAEARQLRDLAALDLQLAEERDAAQTALAVRTAAQREQANATTVASAVQTADILSGLLKKGSMEAALAAKGSALFGVVVNTAEAITKAGAQLGAFAVPAQIALGVLGAAQAAAIASAPMPSFDRGGVVDGGPQYPGGRPGQRLAQVEDGEMVLTRKMQEAMGGGQQTIILKVGSREFGRAVIDSGATDGLQRRRGVGQRRYGG